MKRLSDNDLDEVDRYLGAGRVSEAQGAGMIVGSDLTAEIRRLRALINPDVVDLAIRLGRFGMAARGLLDAIDEEWPDGVVGTGRLTEESIGALRGLVDGRLYGSSSAEIHRLSELRGIVTSALGALHETLVDEGDNADTWTTAGQKLTAELEPFLAKKEQHRG